MYPEGGGFLWLLAGVGLLGAALPAPVPEPEPRCVTVVAYTLEAYDGKGDFVLDRQRTRDCKTAHGHSEQPIGEHNGR